MKNLRKPIFKNTEHEIKRAIEMCKEGKFYYQVAPLFGVSVSTVSIWCKNSGLKAGWKSGNRKIDGIHVRELKNHVYRCHKCNMSTYVPFEFGQHLKDGCHAELTVREVLELCAI